LKRGAVFEVFIFHRSPVIQSFCCCCCFFSFLPPRQFPSRDWSRGQSLRSVACVLCWNDAYFHFVFFCFSCVSALLESASQNHSPARCCFTLRWTVQFCTVEAALKVRQMLCFKKKKNLTQTQDFIPGNSRW
jgi:hypothetical protein